MNVRITSLKVFVDLAQTGSFSETAARNGISQPAVSQQIGNLEAEFSTALVERSRRRFRLTPAGGALLQTAREMLQCMENLKSRMADIEQSVTGELRVTTTFTLGIDWLPRIAQRVKAAYPGIHLEPVYRAPGRLYADLAGNVSDFALVACPKENDRFTSIVLAEEPFCFVMAGNHARRIRSQDIGKQPFVAYYPDPQTAALVEEALTAMSWPVNPSLEFDHADTVIKAVQTVSGFACLPRTSVKDALAQGLLSEVFLGEVNVRRQIAAVFPRQRANQPLLKTVREFLERSKGGWSGEMPSAAIPDAQNTELSAA